MAEKRIVEMTDVNKETGEVEAIIYPQTLAEAVLVGDENLQEKLENLESADKDLYYTNSTPTVSTLGGVGIGETFDNVSVTDMLTKLLYPYVAPTISIGSTVAKGYKEIGTSFDATLTATAVKKSEAIQSVSILKGETVLAEVTDGSLTASCEETGISTTTTYTAKVVDKKNKAVTATLAYTFVHPMYAGVVSSDSPEAAEIKALTKNVIGKSNQSVTYTLDAAHMCFACPPGWTVKTITDPNGFDITSSFNLVTVNLGTEESPVNYNVYVSGVTTQSGFKVTFTAA